MQESKSLTTHLIWFALSMVNWWAGDLIQFSALSSSLLGSRLAPTRWLSGLLLEIWLQQ